MLCGIQPTIGEVLGDAVPVFFARKPAVTFE